MEDRYIDPMSDEAGALLRYFDHVLQGLSKEKRRLFNQILDDLPVFKEGLMGDEGLELMLNLKSAGIPFTEKLIDAIRVVNTPIPLEIVRADEL
jgi:hypothetical protein